MLIYGIIKNIVLCTSESGCMFVYLCVRVRISNAQRSRSRNICESVIVRTYLGVPALYIRVCGHAFLHIHKDMPPDSLFFLHIHKDIPPDSFWHTHKDMPMYAHVCV